ncbi:hypothetical protein L6J37_20555 [Photobacterium sp. WH77]|uniref:hypothetical protein n=1 Tax=unclassified Photobacterium TaxID=2628852 RepID=UPI001EDA1242|nr:MULTISPECIES: hypothetical protein [unclassified Photobacterium]MCG2839226.1 hypothetical protein [Photobacterium sp. WH77]MCG2846843.1 hypothetical protein [Photobacterium sp. WH80]
MLLTMADSELLRIKLIQDICDKRLTGVKAARLRLLKLSPRQVYRLVKRFIELGLGQPGNHRHDEILKLQTLAHEKLSEAHNIHVSVETLRRWSMVSL